VSSCTIPLSVFRINNLAPIPSPPGPGRSRFPDSPDRCCMVHSPTGTHPIRSLFALR
jgi:hypothetical protein